MPPFLSDLLVEEFQVEFFYRPFEAGFLSNQVSETPFADGVQPNLPGFVLGDLQLDGSAQRGPNRIDHGPADHPVRLEPLEGRAGG